MQKGVGAADNNVREMISKGAWNGPNFWAMNYADVALTLLGPLFRTASQNLPILPYPFSGVLIPLYGREGDESAKLRPELIESPPILSHFSWKKNDSLFLFF